MASNYVPLEQAAKALGIPADRLVEMRSQGEIRGFKDGASWKFPQDEIDRLLAESGVNAGEEDDQTPGGSSILVSEPGSGSATGSDASAGSDVALVARQGDGSDVQVVPSRSGAEPQGEDADVEDADDNDLRLADEDDLKLSEGDESGVLDLAVDSKEGSTGPVIGAEDVVVAEEGGTGPESDIDLQRHGSDADVLGDLDLVGAEQGGTDDLIQGDSDPHLAGGPDDVDDALSDDDDLVIADDDDDLVIGGAESDISVAGDSGVNLMSPSDSGLSLESEPLDLAGSSISALDLGGEASASPSKGGSGSGSLVDFEADEEFQLSPSGVGVDAEDDSGSQVIEVEDSAAFGGDLDDDAFGGGTEVVGEGLLDGDAMGADDALVAEDAMADEGFGIEAGGPAPAGAAVPVAYETPFSMWSVIALAGILLLMSLGGMLMTDLMRNMWAYSEPAAPVSSLTDALISMFGLDG